MALAYPHLFQPIGIGTKQSRNRIMRLATQTYTGKDGSATDLTVAVYRRVARGGAGIVITESMRVHASNPETADTLQLYRKQAVPGLERVVKAVHAEGALLIVQINHGGRQHQSSRIPMLWAPSAVACPYSGGVPHQMSHAEIADMRDGWVTSALHAQQAGADGVEIHAAQGHLLQEFYSPYSNKRDDEYGGSLENRLRLAREIISSVREKAGADFIIGYRMGFEEFTAGGITVEDSKQATAQLVKLGMIDYLSLAQGNFNSFDSHCPDAHYPPVPFVDLQAQIKAVASGLPVVASTRIQTPEQAEAIVAEGKADLVGMSRAFIADPEWPLKAMEGRSSDIRRCISTNYCHGTSRRISCEINPTVGNELSMPLLEKVKVPKRVVVVGGGPAGMEAAHIAAERGHQVVLFEKSTKLGGKLTFARHYLPFHESSHALDFLLGQVEKQRVDVRTATFGLRESVLKEKPDAVIVATGSEIYAPAVAGDGSVPVVTYSSLPAGATVLVMDEDGYYWGSCMTEQLARRGCKVVYVTRFTEPLRELTSAARMSTLRVIDELGVVLRPTMYVDRIDNGDVILRHFYNSRHEERFTDIGEVVWVGAQRANDSLASELRDAGLNAVHLVGDAYMPRRLANAFAEGHRAARAI